jgi:hypothetical protein
MKNSKKLCLLALFVTLCVVLLSCGSSGGAAAKADTGPGTPTLATGEWMVYNDVESDKGSSTVSINSAEETIDGNKVMVHHVSGNVTTQFKYGFAGWGLNADEKTTNLYKTAKSLSFWILGDGQRYTIKFKTSNVTDYGYFEYSFDTEKGVPLLIEVPMKYFMQPSWATSTIMKQALVLGVEWQTHENWRKDANRNPFEIKTWGFTVYN